VKSGSLRRFVAPLVVACLVAVAPLARAPVAGAAGGALGYTFENGTDGFTAPTWLSANAGQPVQSTGQVAEGGFSLALPVSFTGGGFDQAGADKVIDNFNPVDLSGYRAVQFSVFAPVPNISADLVFVGGVPLEETVRFYQAADVFVYPSLNETFGLPILEAMACGCPVVTSDTSAMPETAGGAAVLSNPKDPPSIARAIVSAAGPGREHLRTEGLKRASQFTWAATGAATLDVYREAAERRRRRRA